MYLSLNDVNLFYGTFNFSQCIQAINSVFLKIAKTQISYLIVASIAVILCSLSLSMLTDKIGLSSLIFGMDLYISSKQELYK